MPIEVGDVIPSVDLYEDPKDLINTLDFCKGKRVIIVGVPGAFTPNCSQTHLPGFVEMAEKLKDKGIDDIACISVNDPFVMAAWGKCQKTEGKIRLLADPKAEFTEAIGMELTMKEILPLLGNVRSLRYVMIVDDGVVQDVEIEADQIGLTKTLSESIYEKL